MVVFASTANREQMQRLDEAYPLGSIVVLHSDFPGETQPTHNNDL